MNRRTLALLFTAAACAGRPPSGPAIITEAGEPIGAASTAMIGPAGGSLRSPDGSLTLEVPAGALAAMTTLSIQPITNTAPLGLPGAGFRLGPSGQTFDRPVKLTFQAANAQLAGSSPRQLWFLTQTTRGAWRGMVTSKVDDSQKTVSVETKHFSDWNVGHFVDLQLDGRATVRPGGLIGLRVVGFEPAEPDPSEDEDELAPIVTFAPGVERVIIPEPLRWRRTFNAKAWTLSGAGSLISEELHATYLAPPERPEMNVVTVSVQLVDATEPSKETMLLVKEIAILTDGVLVKFEGREYQSTGTATLIRRERTDRPPALFLNVNAVDWTFELSLEAPARGNFTVKDCDGTPGYENAVTFSPRRDYTYSETYRQRSQATGVCVRKTGDCKQPALTVTVDSFQPRTDALISGSFAGTIYEDEILNPGRLRATCETSRAHFIEGSFAVAMEL